MVGDIKCKARNTYHESRQTRRQILFPILDSWKLEREYVRRQFIIANMWSRNHHAEFRIGIVNS